MTVKDPGARDAGINTPASRQTAGLEPEVDIHALDTTIQTMLVETFVETAIETINRSGSRLTAMREGVVAASMMLAAVTGIEDQSARDLVRKWARHNPDLNF